MNRQHRREASSRGDGSPEDRDPPADSALDVADLGTADEPDAEVRAGTTRAERAGATVEHRFAPRQFLHEVNVELRKVAWPTRAETLNYSAVVLVTLVVITSLIFGLDLGFSKLAGFLFNP